MKNSWKSFVSPFVKVAGAKALAWGVAGLAVSAAAACFSGWHAHGLLHFGPSPNNAWWVFAVEYLAIWIVPSILVYGLGAALSKSRIRAVDVFGTMSFSLLPLAAMNLIYLLPPMKRMLTMFGDPNIDLAAMAGSLASPSFVAIGIAMTVLIVWMLVWMFNAVRVSCNLGGWRLWATYVVGVVVGDLLSRLVIGLMQ